MRTIFLSVLFTLPCLMLNACDSRTDKIALGTLERDRIAHTATAAEVVVALPIAQGSAVEKGQLLVQLDNTLQAAQVEHAKAGVAEAEAELDKLRNGARAEEVAAARANVAGAKATRIESETNYQRSQNLVERELESQANLDRALANRDAALAALQAAQQARQELTNGTREEDLHRGEAQLQAAKATLASESKMLADLSVTATRTGVLDSLPWNLGERVTLGSPLAIVLAGKAPFARVYVPEPYRVHIKTGDTLPVLVDGLDTPIPGRVRWIATEPAFTPYYALNQEDRSRLMYLAEVQLPESAADLPSGVPAQVQLSGATEK